MAGGHVPLIIVLSLGAGVLGGPDALRLLLQFAGRSAAVDLAICVVAISVVTAPLLGTMLLARFVRKPGADAGARGGATATDLFAHMTATVSVGAAFLVTACLLVVPGGLGSVRNPIDFAIKNPIVTVLVICATALAATGSLPCAVPLPGVFRGAGSASPAAPTWRIKIVFLVTMSLIAAFVASGGFDAQLFFPGFHWRSPITNMPVGVAIVMVAGTALVLCCTRRARNASGVSGGAAAPTATS